MRERRNSPRRPVSIPGLLSFEHGKRVAPCRLTNLADGGALVRLSAKDVPDDVSLFFDHPDDKLRVEAAWCRVVRREAQHIALQFLYSGAVDRSPA